MGDLISRQATIDAIVKWAESHNENPDGDDCIMILRELPTAQPAPKWISVSERLPKSKPEDLEYPTVIACCEDGEIVTACYDECIKKWGTGEYYDRKIYPVAWMPLPEPFKEVTE